MSPHPMLGLALRYCVSRCVSSQAPVRYVPRHHHDVCFFHAASTSASFTLERYFHWMSPPTSHAPRELIRVSWGEHSANHLRDSTSMSSGGLKRKPTRFALAESVSPYGLFSGFGDQNGKFFRGSRPCSWRNFCGIQTNSASEGVTLLHSSRKSRKFCGSPA